MAGAGAGAIIGASVGHASNDETWSKRSSMVWAGAGVGSGVGALTGWVISLARR
jgi:hypothetical protein